MILRAVQRPSWLTVDLLVAGALVAGVLVVYVARLLPGVGFSDTGVYQAAGPSLGITHPTGYPLFVVLGKLFTSIIPFGSPAYKVNLLTATSGAVAAGALYLLARRLGTGRIVAAALPLVLAFSLMFWRTSTRADPHPLHAALVIILLLLAVRWRQEGAPFRLLLGGAFLYGLSLGNHMLMVMVAPAIALFVLLTDVRTLLPRRLVPLIGAFLAGFAIYLYLPIRALQGLPFQPTSRPPATWDAFWNYVLGGDFTGGMGFLSPLGPGMAANNLPRFLASLGESMTPIGAWLIVALAVLGAGRLIIVDRNLGISLLLATLLPLYVALTYSNADIERYYFTSLTVIVIFAGVGAELLTGKRFAPARLVPHLRYAPPVLLFIPALLLQLNAERAGNISAECFTREMLATAKPNAVVMAWWLNSTPLWYAVHAEGARPDVDVINAADEVYELLPTYVAGSRPIYLVQPDGIIDAVSEEHDLAPIRLSCGDTIFELRREDGNEAA